MSIVQTHLLPLAVIALGGAVGAVMRFWLSGFVAGRIGETFPWGTLVVNVSGAAALGFLAGWWVEGGGTAATSILWLGLVTGILGSYTTVSSFSLQTLALLRGGERLRAGWNIVASLLLCLGATAGGFVLGSLLS